MLRALGQPTRSELRFVLAVLAAATAVFWILAGLNGLRREGRFVRYAKDIKLVFARADRGEYPDGTLFSPTNLIDPLVLGKVYADNGLADLGVAADAFGNAFGAQAYAPESELIVRRYRDLLAGGSLSTAEIAALEGQFSQELEQASRSGVQLVLTVPAGLISDDMARKLLDDIPVVWQRHMIERRGVLRADLPLVRPASLAASLSRSVAYDYLLLHDVLRGRLQDTLANITALRALPNSARVVDLDTGLGLGDLENVLLDLRDFSLEHVSAAVTGFGVSRDREMTIRYFRRRIEDLTREKQGWNQKASLVANSFDEYVATAGSRAGELASTEPLGGGAMTRTTPGFGGDFLARLLEMGSSAADVEFRQELSRERLKYALAAAELESEATRLQEVVRRLEASGNERAAIDSARLEQEVGADLAFAHDSLRRLMGTVGALADELDRLNHGSEGALYRDLGTATSRAVSAFVLTSANLRWYMLLVLGLLMTVLVGLAVRSSGR